MRSTSSRSSVAWPGRPSTTPSMTVATLGSTPGEVEMVPTPRRNNEVSLLEAPVRKVRLGTSAGRLATLLRFSRSSASPWTTDTATGTCCKVVSRRVAVTVTVPKVCAARSGVVAGSPTSSASTGVHAHTRLQANTCGLATHLEAARMRLQGPGVAQACTSFRGVGCLAAAWGDLVVLQRSARAANQAPRRPGRRCNAAAHAVCGCRERQITNV